MRPSGRAADQLREVSLEPGFAKYAEGSCLVRFGETHVICAASLDDRVPPFLRNSGTRNRFIAALGKLGIELTREALNSYRQQVQKYGSDWPRFSWMVNGLHSLLDQEYSGDINIVPRTPEIGLFEFEKAQEAINAGREAAERALPDIDYALDVLDRVSGE